MMDEEIAAVAAKVIFETAHLGQFEQSGKMHAAGYAFMWMMSADKWIVADIANRVIHDESAAKKILCDRLFRPGNEDSERNCALLLDGKFVHFQVTSAFDGGVDAYVVFRVPRCHNAVIVRISTMAKREGKDCTRL